MFSCSIVWRVWILLHFNSAFTLSFSSMHSPYICIIWMHTKKTPSSFLLWNGPAQKWSVYFPWMLYLTASLPMSSAFHLWLPLFLYSLQEGLTALMIATRNGNLAIVTELLQNGKYDKDFVNAQEKVIFFLMPLLSSCPLSSSLSPSSSSLVLHPLSTSP